jgi:tetratricopeptide (TPR) repeat protein
MQKDLTYLTTLLRRHEYPRVLEELDKLDDTRADDFKLIRFVAELRTNPQGMARDVLQQAHSWSFTCPDIIFSECAFLALALGRPDDALDILSSASQINFTAVEYSRLGTAHLLLGDFVSALDNYTKAVELEPDNADMHNNLGGAYVRLQQLEKALESYEKALELRPDHPQAVNSRLTVAGELGKGETALDDLERKFSEDPESIELRLALFHALLRLRREVEAYELIKEGLVDFKTMEPIDPADLKDNKQYIDQINLRMALFDFFASRQRWVKALAVINQCLALFTEPPADMVLRRITVLAEIKEFDHAMNLLDGLAENEQVNPEFLTLSRADLYSKMGRENEALDMLDELTVSKGLAKRYLTLKGHLLLSLGRIEECHDVLLELSSRDIMAFVQLISTRNYQPDDKVLKRLKSLADNPLIAEGPRESVSFALSQVYDKQKDYDLAFHYLARANIISDRKVKYNPQLFTRKVQATIHAFTPEVIQKAPRLPKSSPIPIFVLGMPRSGTTLTESILGSHNKVQAAGELPNMSMITRAVHNQFKGVKPYPISIGQLNRDQLIQMAKAYLRHIPDECQGAEYIVDKMPHNFMHVGLISILFPNSPIVHVQRDPRDTALSNFQQNFGAKFGGMGYAFDLVKLARQINDYHKVMAHWRSLNIPMYEFRYEDLVADQVGITKELLEHAGLDWDEGVMEFHKLKRSVRTASVAQVRQKIYKTSARKWRRYEKHLQPLLEVLDPQTTALWDNNVLAETDKTNPVQL